MALEARIYGLMTKMKACNATDFSDLVSPVELLSLPQNS
jgi:hypothetical protein